MLVTEFCENRVGDFPDAFYECLPTVCEECGYPMEMSETLTQLHCGNPKCVSKVVQRLVAIASQLGVKDLGVARATMLCQGLGVTNPLLIFALDATDEVPGWSPEVRDKIIAQVQEKTKFTLAEYVRVANLPFIQMSAFSLFEGYDDLAEAYEAIERGGIEYIRDRLNIKESGTENVSVRALKCYESLMTFKDDLFEALPFVQILKVHSGNVQMLKAVCSDEVGAPFRTKAEFYAYCNNNYEDVHVEFGNSVTKKTDYLVWAGADGGNHRETNKVKKAKGYQAQGVPIKIVTATEFMLVLQQLKKGE